jgi:hypothetical protein
MQARLRSLSGLVLETFGGARHPRFAIAMVCLSGFLAGSLTTTAVLMPQDALIVASLAPTCALSLCFAMLAWGRPGSSGGRDDGREPPRGPHSPDPDRWPCRWYDTLWNDQLPDEPSALRRMPTVVRR